MQQCREHNGIVRFNDAPVVDSFELNGRIILTSCRRNLDDAIRDMKLLVERSLPQNVATLQEVKDGQSAAGDVGSVSAGNPVRVVHGVRGGKTGR